MDKKTKHRLLMSVLIFVGGFLVGGIIGGGDGTVPTGLLFLVVFWVYEMWDSNKNKSD